MIILLLIYCCARNCCVKDKKDRKVIYLTESIKYLTSRHVFYLKVDIEKQVQKDGGNEEKPLIKNEITITLTKDDDADEDKKKKQISFDDKSEGKNELSFEEKTELEQTIENLQRTEDPEPSADSKEGEEENKDNTKEGKEENKDNKTEHSVDEVDDNQHSSSSSSPRISPLPKDHPSHREEEEEIAKKAQTLRDLTKVRWLVMMLMHGLLH